MVDKTLEANKLKKNLDKKKEEILKNLKKDMRILSSFTNKPKLDYNSICQVSGRIYKNSEALKDL